MFNKTISTFDRIQRRNKLGYFPMYVCMCSFLRELFLIRLFRQLRGGIFELLIALYKVGGAMAYKGLL